MSLNQEIRQIKKESFSELKWVWVRGIYVPDFMVLRNNHLAGINFDYTKRVFAKGKLVFAAGFADILIAKSLSSPSYSDERRGIVAHEISHILVEEDSEKIVDNIALERGYAYDLMRAAKLVERLRFNRRSVGSYDSRELASMI